MISAGIDIGSTTIKAIVLDDHNQIIYSSYERHFSRISEKLNEILKKREEGPLKGRSFFRKGVLRTKPPCRFDSGPGHH